MTKRINTAMLSLILLFTSLSLSSALDMSIISYDNQHGQKPSTGRTDDEVMAMFEEWLVKHGKSYNGLGEKGKRFEIFKDNLRYIDEQNADGNRTYKLGLSPFADLTNEEYRSTYLGTRVDPSMMSEMTPSARYLPREGVLLPSSVDWRTRGVLLPVKEQGTCESCWAFSAVASVEAVNQIVTGELISLSEQELVDCEAVGAGCHRGLMNHAFQFIIDNGGIDTEEDYPYIGEDMKCNATKRSRTAVTIDSYEIVPRNNERALQWAVSHQPVSVAVDSSGRDFQHYESGIFTGECGTILNHGVNVVGYDTDDSGVDYWIVRNSWGEKWGEGGYIRMKRYVAGFRGLCGIAYLPSYPVKKRQVEPIHPPSILLHDTI